ncbi:type IV pilus twitching motility protein PilT [Sanguibacter suarezii]|uniref:type IV pilus twitching motility protein PilT n=1 Tax=Sanguibacter suarezii TaxID=60921 RepID=UPI001FDFF0CA|nr:type IV pilus twitching motility protein PilT [Sanguibacter suarezii]
MSESTLPDGAAPFATRRTMADQAGQWQPQSAAVQPAPIQGAPPAAGTPQHPSQRVATSDLMALRAQQAAPAPVRVSAVAPQPQAPAAPQQHAAPPPPAQRARPASGQARIGMSRQVQDSDVVLDAVLREMVEARGSDLHLTVGAPPMVRRDGSLFALDQHAQVTQESLQRTLYAILTQKQREKFEANLELDFSYAVRGLARFRVNFYQQRESIGAAFRVIPYDIKPLEDLGIPAVVANFAGLPRGLVLVAGPTGSGKSTTLASIVDLANRTRSDHIMTVEDPIEFLHRHKKSIINQREVGSDTHSFANALKHVLRQDPDIILVGEMRDLETISVALTAAETGHLVFATLHTQDAAQTIDRIIDVFPPEQQGQVRTQLAGALQGVVCQTLCKRADGPGRAVATEVMIATPAIRNLIREGKTHQVYSAMQAGSQQGMHTMDQHLADLTRAGRISYETGLEKCQHITDYNRLTGRATGSTAGAGLANANMGGSSHQNRTV